MDPNLYSEERYDQTPPSEVSACILMNSKKGQRDVFKSFSLGEAWEYWLLFSPYCASFHLY